MALLIIILVIILGFLGWWLSTIRLVKPPSGETIMIGAFDKPSVVVGNTVPNTPITNKIISLSPAELRKIQPRLDVDTSWYLTIWPQRVQTFDYRYKHYKPIDEIKSTGGTVVWQPTIPTKADGTLLYAENPGSTIALGEWKEVNKKSLWRKERESIAIKFISQDPIRGVKKAYIRFIIWDMTLAANAVRNPKEDAEKKIIDLFQEWSKDKDYFKDIQGINFDTVAGKKFIKDLNKEIYQLGVVVEGVDFFEDFIEPGSQDVYDAKEKISKEKLLKKSAEIDADIKKIEGEGERDKQLAINMAQQDLLEKQKIIKIAEDKGLKENQIDQHRQNLENEKKTAVAQFKEQTEIVVDANGRIIEKVIELKKVVDETTKIKFEAIKDSKITTYVDSAGSNGPVDNFDEDISKQIKANLVTLPKQKGGDDEKS